MKHPDYYSYPAIFQPDSDMWMVTFPDIENAFTSADTLEEAIVEAQAVLEDCLYFREEQGDEIPSPTPLENLVPPTGGLAQMVVAVMPPARHLWSHKSVKRTVTIPVWMENELHQYDNAAISLLFQEAVKEKLHVTEPVTAY